jgi:hypothetical protein
MQTESFVAGLEYLMREYDPTGSVPVDPRPVVVRERQPPTAYAEADSSLVAAREALVQREGRETANVFPMLENCSGLLSPPGAHTGCPESGVVRQVAFGHAVEVPGQSVRTLPQVTFVYSRFGSEIVVRGLILEVRDGRWAVTGQAYRVSWE